MKISGKIWAVCMLLACGCLWSAGNVSAKVCFVGDSDCAGGADFGDGYTDDSEDLCKDVKDANGKLMYQKRRVRPRAMFRQFVLIMPLMCSVAAIRMLIRPARILWRAWDAAATVINAPVPKRSFLMLPVSHRRFPEASIVCKLTMTARQPVFIMKNASVIPVFIPINKTATATIIRLSIPNVPVPIPTAALSTIAANVPTAGVPAPVWTGRGNRRQEMLQRRQHLPQSVLRMPFAV